LKGAPAFPRQNEQSDIRGKNHTLVTSDIYFFSPQIEVYVKE